MCVRESVCSYARKNGALGLQRVRWYKKENPVQSSRTQIAIIKYTRAKQVTDFCFSAKDIKKLSVPRNKIKPALLVVFRTIL